MRILFVSGPARSGTTAFADYLNQHEEILVCRERYKYVIGQVNPDFFTFSKILNYEPYEPQLKQGETNVPKEYHEKLLAEKDPAKLRWIGDKHPGYIRALNTVNENNPGASFILTYRPIEEVAESFERRSKNPEDTWLGGKDGFRLGVEYWNTAMEKTCEFLESDMNPHVLLISYHDFFYRNEKCIPLISHFLDLDFNEAVSESWRKMSADFEQQRREKESLSEEQRALIESKKNSAAEQQVLNRINEQWRELEAYTESTAERRPLEMRREFAANLPGERSGAKIRNRSTQQTSQRFQNSRRRIKKVGKRVLRAFSSIRAEARSRRRRSRR